MITSEVNSSGWKYYLVGNTYYQNAIFEKEGEKSRNVPVDSMVVDQIKSNNFSTSYASDLLSRGTHVIVVKDFFRYVIEINLVAERCGISKNEARQVILDNRASESYERKMQHRMRKAEKDNKAHK